MSLVDEYVSDPDYQVTDGMTASLNQTDIQKNSNKYYILQLLNKNGQYFIWTRYGRTGERGRGSLKSCYSKMDAISDFRKIFRQKVGDEWGKPFSSYVQKPGKYIPIEIDTGSSKEIVPSSDEITESRYNFNYYETKFLRELMDTTSAMKTLVHFGVDTEKMPLGKLSSSQIAKGHEILTRISGILNPRSDYFLNNFIHLTPYDVKNAIISESSAFWSNIPYACGRRLPPTIDSIDKVNNYAELLYILENLEVTKRVISKGRSIDSFFEELEISLSTVDPNSSEFLALQNYVNTTKAPSHNYKVRVDKIFRIDKSRQDYEDPSNLFAKTTNHTLLFHGSRTANFVGILKEGLRIPKSSQVSNGSTLGRGIYFANSVTKSFNYCYADSGYVLVCEVALGNQIYGVQSCISDERVVENYESVRAYGEMTTDPSSHLTFNNNILIPSGKLVSSGKQSSFRYDEFVIYNRAQYRFRYLIKLGKYKDIIETNNVRLVIV